MIYDYEGELDENQKPCGFGFAKCTEYLKIPGEINDGSFEMNGTFLNGR